MQTYQVKLIESFTVTRECVVSTEADSMADAVDQFALGQLQPPEFEDASWAEFWCPEESNVVGAMKPFPVDLSGVMASATCGVPAAPKEPYPGPYGPDTNGEATSGLDDNLSFGRA